MDITQVVPVSVVGTQSLFRVPEISEVPSSDRGQAERLPGRWFQGSFSSRLSLHFLEGLRAGKMQFRSRAHLGNLPRRMRVRPGRSSNSSEPPPTAILRIAARRLGQWPWRARAPFTSQFRHLEERGKVTPGITCQSREE